MIESDKQYTVKSSFLKQKYGEQPIIRIEDKWINISGGSSARASGAFGAVLGIQRINSEVGHAAIFEDDKLYYGHIYGMGELVHESELEPV